MREGATAVTAPTRSARAGQPRARRHDTRMNTELTPGPDATYARAMTSTIISADSHVTEPPDAYAEIDPAFRERAPKLVRHETLGDIFVIDGMRQPIPMGLVAAAGKSAEQIATFGVKFDELHRGGWDPEARLADQDRDGVAGEILYPTVGMALCNHKDLDYKKACMDAYNRWIVRYCAAHPDRLFGIGQTAMRTPAEGVADLRAVKALGLRGVMMPGYPGEKDYDDPAWDPVWEAAVELTLPLSFHILTTREDHARVRGPKMNAFLAVIRGCQDVLGTMILSGVFERHPRLRIVCVEADAGWVPHYMYRMDHAYKRHRYWLPAGTLSKLPSEYFRENVYTTFQDDWVAFQMTKMVNVERIMWANDFPHSDSTWPWSQDVLREHTKHLTDVERDRILHDNVAELYGLS
jgi:predicted TIM-barrel fold metal-dependent hydrolase